jgi:hypothetical protein
VFGHLYAKADCFAVMIAGIKKYTEKTHKSAFEGLRLKKPKLKT